MDKDELIYDCNVKVFYHGNNGEVIEVFFRSFTAGQVAALLACKRLEYNGQEYEISDRSATFVQPKIESPFQSKNINVLVAPVFN
ncbi:hypothetical protein [Bacillus atrophaeus]|uniref:hypothetical protein n=1 Tax=Bacillus atrophaeus TaxID=1452 RepID=UPI00240D8413|nr:hypothetical protein [Bacillus atrophaeus]